MTEVKLSQIASGGAYNPATDTIVAVRTGPSDVRITLGTAAVQPVATFAQVANNLSDLTNAGTARTNLGLGTAALQNTSAFLQGANNLSDVASPATARTNLGLNVPEVTIGVGSTVNLGGGGSPNVLVNGTGTIADFGSAASLNYPDYTLRFNAAVTLTHSSALLCPNNTDVTLASQDSVHVRYLGSSNWIVLNVFQFGGGSGIVLNSLPNLVYSGGTLGLNATFYNVRDFGAKGDGVTNDNTAFSNCIAAAAAAAYGGVVYIPQGVYVLTQQFVATIATGSPVNLYFKGDGPNVSVLQWTTATGGIRINFNSQTLQKGLVGAEGLTFYTKTVNGGNGLMLVGNSTVGPGPVKRVFNCLFAGDNATTYWTNGLVMDACTYTSTMDCKFQGLSAGFSGTGMVIQNSQTPHAVGHEINQCFFWGLSTGLSAGTNIEGISVANSNFLGGTGISWNGSSSGLPSLIVVGCDIDATVYGIQTQNVVQMTLNDNLFYGHIGSIGIFVNNNTLYGTSDNNQICHNIFMAVGGGQGSVAISLLNTQYNIVTDNRIDNFVTGIWLRSGTTNCNAKNNSITTATNFVLDQGVADNVSLSLAGYTALVAMSGNQSIPSGTNTVVVWGTATKDPLSIWDGSTKLVVPPGVSKVRLSANTIWAAGNSTNSSLIIQKNGSGYPGIANNLALANPSYGNSQSTKTAVLTVVYGDYFTAVVAQNSGGSLNLVSGNATWFEMEILG